MTFKERIVAFAVSKGLSVKALQEELGLSNSYFSNVNKVSPSVAMKMVAKYPNLSIDWINNGRGEMLTDDNSPVYVSNFVPLLPISAIGGNLNDFEEQVQSYDCERIICPIMDATMAITVTGDSMSPEYPNGSIVFIKKINEKSFIEWGRTYVLNTTNGTVIKNVFPCKENQENVLCRSVNPNFADFEVPKADIRGWYLVKLQMSRK